MGEAAQVHRAAAKDVAYVVGMQRFDERVRPFGEVHRVVALDGLIEKRQPEREHQPENLYAGFHRGFHRKMGLRAAVTSSTRLVRVP